jgi:RimJ/RimL family protein N-acetyltransferase
MAVSFRQPTDDDPERIAGWTDSPASLLQWAGPVFSFPFDAAQLRDHLGEIEDSGPTHRAYAAAADGRLVGYLELADIDRENRSARVARVIVDPAERGNSYGTAMVREIVRIGFDELGLHRIGLRVFDFNEVAIGCYETVGFVREGVLRDVRRHGEEYWSLVTMSYLETERSSDE